MNKAYSWYRHTVLILLYLGTLVGMLVGSNLYNKESYKLEGMTFW